MTTLAVALVLSAAFIHATWNFLAKRAGASQAFFWLFTACSAVLYAPVVAIVMVWQETVLTGPAVLYLLGSATIHSLYYLMLSRGYRMGDLSLVYPLARATGPLLSASAAIVIYGERPSALAIFGAIAIAGGAFALTGSRAGLRKPGAHRAVGYALLTGTMIACYTLWDKYAVATILIAPLLLDYFSNCGRVCLMSPIAFRQWGAVKEEWRRHRFEVLGAAVLCPLSYILVLTALKFSPVSYVAPAREFSILVGAVMGTQFLAEGDARRRLAAAGAMVIGVSCLALG